MPKRFNNLNAALRYLNPKGTDDGTATGEAPAGSQLREYQDWRSGKRSIEYGDRPDSSKPKNLIPVAVKPFAIPSTDTDEYIVDLSDRADKGKATASVTDTLLGYKTDLSSAQNVSNFTPARVTISSVGTGATTTATSKITGRKYKKKNTSSYTYPIGQTTANKSYKEIKTAIVAAIASGTNLSASFSAEIYR